MYPVINGKRLNLRGRKHCLECRPIRHLEQPRKKVERLRRTKICESCGGAFPAKLVIDGKMRSLYRRRFCFECSPFGAHNTSKSPPMVAPQELPEHRRRKQNAKIYRSQKRRRKRRKNELVALAGGRCVDCGYAACIAALEFHHRDPSTKEFGVGNFGGSLEKLMAEFVKCDLLCANCHRIRHAIEDDGAEPDRLFYARRELKQRAVAYMGSTCGECDRHGRPAVFEFHHIDATEKDFGISRSGIIRAWDKIVAELEKCVMLCANCHREVHAGVRAIRPTLLGLAEDALPYVA
jgi:hypothetical protein